MSELNMNQRWELVDKISDKTVQYGAYSGGLREALAEQTVKPLTGIPFALAVLYGFWAFFSAFAGFFTDGYFVPLFDNFWLPFLQDIWPESPHWLYYIFVGDPAATNSFEAFGVLTSGLFVAIGIVLPAIVAFYLIITILEDTGYIPRLAVLVDTFLHKIGLHGFAIVPMILALGCNVPGIVATRNLEEKRQRFIMMTLLAIFIPCGAQLGIMFTLIPEYVGYVLLYLILGFFVFGYLLDLIIPGSSPEIITDVPPFRLPSIKTVGRKMWMRTRSFFADAIPFVLLGVAVVNVLYLSGTISWLAFLFRPVLTGWFGIPAETVAPLIAGFFRKDLAVAQLSRIDMTAYQLVISVVIVTIYFPCLATFSMLIKEGRESGGIVVTLLGSVTTMLVVLFLWGGLLNLVGIFLGVN